MLPVPVSWIPGAAEAAEGSAGTYDDMQRVGMCGSSESRVARQAFDNRREAKLWRCAASYSVVWEW